MQNRVKNVASPEQFTPGSVLAKMTNLRLNTINWKVLSDAADKLDGELATQPILVRRKGKQHAFKIGDCQYGPRNQPDARERE